MCALSLTQSSSSHCQFLQYHPTNSTRRPQYVKITRLDSIIQHTSLEHIKSLSFNLFLLQQTFNSTFPHRDQARTQLSNSPHTYKPPRISADYRIKNPDSVIYVYKWLTAHHLNPPPWATPTTTTVGSCPTPLHPHTNFHPPRETNAVHYSQTVSKKSLKCSQQTETRIIATSFKLCNAT